ncbi:MAG: radical SAM protein [Candidatus Thorarchaeota archaeon]
MSNLVDTVRLSIGTAIQLGLEDGPKDNCFTTAFLMTYVDGKCNANCAFCPQAKESTSSSDRLSRIAWPTYSWNEFVEHFNESGAFRRVCIQVLNYPNAVDDLVEMITRLREATNAPISVSVHPLNKAEMSRLHRAGASSIGIAFDACTESLFQKIKGHERGSPYTWDSHMESLSQALEVFGADNVATHLIVGLGESETEAAQFVLSMKKLGIRVGLFAFTGIRGTSMESVSQPDLGMYRRIQVLRFLVANGLISEDQVDCDASGNLRMKVSPELLREYLSSGEAFQTSGCKDCNRPYYNERPSGPLYNYPRPLTSEEITEALRISGLVN